MCVINDISERHAEVMGLNVRQVKEAADVETVSRLAGDIWRDHYMPIIGLAQVEYMLDRYQCPSAIEHQIAAGYQYFLLFRGSQAAGYFAWLVDGADKSLHISKLYVCKLQQRAGLGSKLIALSERYCQALGIGQIWLTVNRGNYGAIDFYLRNGFVNSGSAIQDIGGGFVMDDYRMLKTLLHKSA